MSKLLFINCQVHLFDDDFSIADSLLIEGGIIRGFGERARQIGMADPQIEIVDLEERTILPGLIDAHIHFASYALNSARIDCETATIEESLERIRARVNQTKPGEWILGHGWNQNLWPRFGTARDLDLITRQHPVYLTAKSGHAAWVNSIALELAQCSASAQDPHGGMIQRDETGAPTGILFEEAMQLISQYIPEPSDTQVNQAMQACQDQLLRMGITGIHDFNGMHSFRALQALHQEGRLGLRVLKMIPYKHLSQMMEIGMRTGFGDDWLRVGQIKLFADGALGPQTAAMLTPYDGDECNIGLLLLEKEQLSRILLQAVRAGLGLSIHAIGDRANRIVLDAFQSLHQEEALPASPFLRHRIEHLQLLHPDDVRRPGDLGLVASMQPIHATSDMDMANRYWGERSRFSYAWKSQLQSGAILAFGSDAPVENPNPFWGLHAATTRRRLDGTPHEVGWIPEERLSLFEAFQAYTYGPAYAAGMEKVQGRLMPGYLADLIVLEDDPFQCSAEELPHLLPLAAIVGGHWRFKDF